MLPYQIWRKMIEAKVYSREVATNRINVVFAVGQLSVEEYEELILLIDEKYPEVA